MKNRLGSSCDTSALLLQCFPPHHVRSHHKLSAIRSKNLVVLRRFSRNSTDYWTPVTLANRSCICPRTPLDKNYRILLPPTCSHFPTSISLFMKYSSHVRKNSYSYAVRQSRLTQINSPSSLLLQLLHFLTNNLRSLTMTPIASFPKPSSYSNLQHLSFAKTSPCS